MTPPTKRTALGEFTSGVGLCESIRVGYYYKLGPSGTGRVQLCMLIGSVSPTLSVKGGRRMLLPIRDRVLWDGGVRTVSGGRNRRPPSLSQEQTLECLLCFSLIVPFPLSSNRVRPVYRR